MGAGQLTGMDLTWEDSGVEVKGETDLAVLTRDNDNLPQMLIGECKTSMELAAEQIDRLVKVSDLMSKAGVKTFILFAKAGRPLTSDELELLNKRQTTDLNFILLTPDELEPFFPYEKALAAGKVRSTRPHSLEQWANYSRTIYLKTDPREILDRNRLP